MMMKRILLLMASLAALVPASAQYSFNGELLDRLAEAYRKGDPRAVKAVEEVAAEADSTLLGMEPLTVTAKAAAAQR